MQNEQIAILHPDQVDGFLEAAETVGLSVSEANYSMGVDVGTGDYTVIGHGNGELKIVDQREETRKIMEGTKAAYGRAMRDLAGKPAKTGRRESAKKCLLLIGQRVGKQAECGHTVVGQPTTNCFDCWHYYFKTNVTLTYALFAYLEKGEEGQIVEVHGKKFLKQFKRFVQFVQNLVPIVLEDVVRSEGAA